jgi:2'-5' RNA ligase
MARIRTFIAVDPGEAIRDKLVAVQESLGRETSDVKWVEDANLHVTLLFLGEVNDRDLLAICRATQEAVKSLPSFSLEIAGVGCFPNPRRPRIVWAGVGTGAAELVALHDALEPPLLELGCYRREERAYTPHITLGRTKSDQPGEQLAKVLPKYQTWCGGSTTIREVQVMSSALSPKGPTYTILARAKLS